MRRSKFSHRSVLVDGLYSKLQLTSCQVLAKPLHQDTKLGCVNRSGTIDVHLCKHLRHLCKERKGKERKGKERKGKERKGKERKGKERKGKVNETGDSQSAWRCIRVDAKEAARMQMLDMWTSMHRTDIKCLFVYYISQNGHNQPVGNVTSCSK
jgi:hypothetical protein